MGEDARLGQGLPVRKHNSRDITQRIDVRKLGTEGVLVHGHPSGVVGKGRFGDRRWRSVRWHRRTQIKLPPRSVLEKQLALLSVDSGEGPIRMKPDVALRQQRRERFAHHRPSDRHRLWLGREHGHLRPPTQAPAPERVLDQLEDRYTLFGSVTGFAPTRLAGSVSYIRISTTTPEANVSSAIAVMAHGTPSRSASTPASSAPSA
jgi:hypothetical protein